MQITIKWLHIHGQDATDPLKHTISTIGDATTKEMLVNDVKTEKEIIEWQHQFQHHTLSMKFDAKPMNLPIQTLPDTNKSLYLLKSIHKLLFDLHFIIQTTRQLHLKSDVEKKKKCHANHH
eukprot:540892_1